MMSDELRRWVTGLIIVVAVAMACGRIASTELVLEPSLHRDETDPGTRRVWPKNRPRPMPTFSSNDRSRWATVRALVDEGTYAVGRRDRATVAVSAVAPVGALDPLGAAVLAQAGYYARTGPRANTGIIFEDGWQSVDKVLHPDTLEFYSSKPPLLSTLLAGLYWLLQRLTGLIDPGHPWTLADDPAEVVRTILVLVNAVPFGAYLWLLARLAGTWGRTDGGRLYVLVAAAFATIVTPFLITLNNHTLGTFCVLAAWYSVLRIWQRPAWYHFVSAGFFSAFAVCNELPALALAAAVLGLLLWSYPSRTLFLAVPAALVLAAGFLVTNYAAVGQWRPAYSEFGSPWYEYEGSHWRKPPPGQTKPGIDWAYQREDRAEYALHVFVGHHGLFTLSPIWLLAVAGMVGGTVGWVIRRPPAPLAARFTPPGPPADGLPWFVHPLGLALTVVVIGFYLGQTETRNYGGWTNGLRWLMWLTPIWLTCLLPLADRLAATRPGRWLLAAALAVSVFSAHYSLWNPWRHPWLYDFLQEAGVWQGY